MFMTKVKTFLRECIRVFKITKKPKKVEFITIVKVAGIGMIVIGLIGFIIHITWQLIK